MPPRSMFDRSHRPDQLVMPACELCNSSTSTADLTASIVSRWHYGITETEFEDHARLAARLRKQAPEIVAEWLSGANEPFHASRGRRHLRKNGVDVPLDAQVVTIGPHTIRQLNIFARKAALALYFEHFRSPLQAPLLYSTGWHTKEDFEARPPIDLLKILPTYATLQQGQWSTSDAFGYRFNINRDEGFFAFSAHLRRGLFVTGFVVPAIHLADDDDEWFSPGDLADLVHSPALAIRQQSGSRSS